MKKIPMIILMITPYIFLGIILNADVGYIPPAWGFACLFVFLPNMIYAFILPKKGYTARQLLFWNMLLKVCNIPVYCVIFSLGLLMGVFIIPLFVFLVLFDYSFLLPSTMFGVSGLLLAYRDNKISPAVFAINIIMQFMFCLDVCSSIYLYASLRKS